MIIINLTDFENVSLTFFIDIFLIDTFTKSVYDQMYIIWPVIEQLDWDLHMMGPVK